MRAPFLLQFSLATLALFASNAWAQAAGAPGRETLKWYSNQFPPYNIKSGFGEGSGAFDRVMGLLIKRMPEFEHDQVDAALPRTIESLKTRTDSCAISLLKTAERETMMDFSRPHTYLLPNGIVILRHRLPSMAPFLNAQGELKLDEFLASGKFRLGLASERSYGSAVDALLRKHAASIVPVAAKDVFASRLLKLTHQREFDAIVGYAVELTYTVREAKLDPRNYAVLPIAESSGLLPVSASCSKSDQGRRALAAIDRVLAEKASQREIDGYYRSWLDEESSAYYEKLLRQARGTP